jgi:hypothetical protein
MRREFLTRAGACSLGLLPVTAALASWGDGEYRIQQALYGTSQRNVDVTQRLRTVWTRIAAAMYGWWGIPTPPAPMRSMNRCRSSEPRAFATF